MVLIENFSVRNYEKNLLVTKLSEREKVEKKLKNER